MKLKQAVCAVLALALIPGLAAIRKGPKVRAAGAHDIQLEISSYNESKESYLDQKVNKGPVTIVGGKVELNTYSAEAGDPITVTITPDAGYEIDHVNWGNGLADGEDITDTCTFTMWDAPAFVSVVFTPTAKLYYSYVAYETIGPAYPTMTNTIFMTAEEAAAYTLPPCTLEVYDLSYAFDYWFRWNDDTRYYPGDPYPVGSDVVVFYAAFKKVDTSAYTVHFSSGEGSDTMADVVLDETSAASYTLPDSTFTPPANMTFIMWGEANTGKLYRPGDTCSIPEEGTTFQALYMINDYFTGSYYGAIFDPGEGTGEKKKIELDNEIDAFRYTVPECDFTAPEGKVFSYWEINGYSYHPGDRYALPADGYVVFTAIWKNPISPCYAVSAGSLNVRSGPSIYATRIGGLTAGKAFQSIDECLENGEAWVSFDYQGQTAWVMKKYLLLTYSVDTAVKPTKCTVNTGVLNVRSSPEKPDSSAPDNRIGSMTNGKEFVVTGVIPDGDVEWLCFEYKKDGKVQLGFVMAKYVDGDFSIIKMSAHSLKIDFTIPTGELNDSKAAVASPDEVNLSAENLENRNDGLLKALIYPADAYSFEDLKKEDITLPDGIGMEVMELVLQDDGAIAITFCPENAVSIAFHDETSGEVITKYISSGNVIEKPADPVKEGEVFDGWYEDEDCTVKFDFTKPVTGDITLYSKFLKTEPEQEPESTDVKEEPASTEPATVEPAAQEIIYTVTSDADSWSRGSVKGITITVKRNIDDAELCFESFRSVSSDGVALIKDKDYSVKKGSTIVTIYPATLEALSDGTHTITVEFADGKSEFTFTIAKPAATATPTPTQAATNAKPKTGDVAPTSRVVALIALCAVGLVAVALIDRRKEENNEE